MSARVMGAVMMAGPRAVRLRLALVAIADNADDFGFAAVSIETIAAKAACDPRTAMRVVQRLEREDWMKVKRRIVDGKGSVYFVNIDKLGIVPDAKSRKSEWHLEFERQMKRAESRDKMSPENMKGKQGAAKSSPVNGNEAASVEPVESGDNLSSVNLSVPENSGDNSQGVQVTIHRGSGDILPVPILKNHEPSSNQYNPHSPRSRGRVDREGSGDFREATDRVMQACDSCDRKLRRVVGGAIEAAVRKSIQRGEAEAPLAVAERMIEAWAGLAKWREFMRYSLGPLTFIAQGFWADDRRWPWDQKKLSEVRRY